MLYKIELRYIHGWDDAGWTEESDDGFQPKRFQNIEYAYAALEEFFAGVKASVIEGNMDMEEKRCDYRIVEAEGRSSDWMRSEVEKQL